MTPVPDLDQRRAALRAARDRGEIVVEPAVCAACGWDEERANERRKPRHPESRWQPPRQRLTPDLGNDGETLHGWVCWHCARLLGHERRHPGHFSRLVRYLERRNA